MVLCVRCEEVIRWPKKPMLATGCTLHAYHKKCVSMGYCGKCREMEVRAFLRQTTEVGLKSHYKSYFDVPTMLKATSNPNQIKFLCKKFNLVKGLVDSMERDDTELFMKIMDNRDLDFYTTYMGKTLVENVKREPYKTILFTKLRESLPPRAAAPRLPPSETPTAPPPSYEEAMSLIRGGS